jgi:hypothetical protein
MLHHFPQEGSAVLQLVYTDIASAQQKHAMYRELWGAEFGLMVSSSEAKVCV